MEDSDIAGKKLLVLGGTKISCEIIREAQKMGVFVGVTDYNTIQDSPGKRIADAVHDISVLDVDKVVELVRKERYNGVIVGFADSLLPWYAEICEKADVPSYATKEQMKLFTNKNDYKKLCRKFGVPTVEEYAVDINATLSDEIVYPVLVKPSDGSGARGISICHNREELREAYSKAMDFSKNKQILVERYIEGKEATVFWTFQDGEYYLSAIGNRHVKHNQNGVIPLPAGYTFPASVTADYLKSIVPHVKDMLRSIGVKNGMMFMQCIISNGRCIVYDIGYRLTGSLEYKLLENICGYSPLKMMIHYALTGNTDNYDLHRLVDPMLCGRYAFNVSLLSKPGKIAKMIGADKILKMDGIIDAVFDHEEGETIPESYKGTLAQIVLRVFGSADSIEDMYTLMKKVHDNFKIISPNGENLLLSGIEKTDLGDDVL